MRKLIENPSLVSPAHPWRNLDQLTGIPDGLKDGCAVSLFDASGGVRGTGIFDRTDRYAVWRRFSYQEEAAFDESYLAESIAEALDRRSEESCQRLVSSDADFVPGLVVDVFQEVVLVSLETLAMQRHEALVLELLREAINPAEVVICNPDGRRTGSGNNLRPRWIEVDGLHYRIDLLQPEHPGFSLALREQHALFGSLCVGRRVLDLGSRSGAFAIQAMRNGAEKAMAVHSDPVWSKAVGANAQRNGYRVEAECGELLPILSQQMPGRLNAIVIECPVAPTFSLRALLQAAFGMIANRGLLCVYMPQSPEKTVDLAGLLREAAAGREARIFAKVTQPFDFPQMLHFPESRVMSGFVLEVL